MIVRGDDPRVKELDIVSHECIQQTLKAASRWKYIEVETALNYYTSPEARLLEEQHKNGKNKLPTLHQQAVRKL